MTYTIIVLLLCVLGLTACTIKIEPLAKPKPVVVHRHGKKHHTAHRRAAAEGAAYVTPQWLNEYHSLEADHGGYVIPDDSRIQVQNDGKIKVPHTVVKHFNDLSRAPVRPAEPKPNE
jgi:hypothetical protein